MSAEILERTGRARVMRVAVASMLLLAGVGAAAECALAHGAPSLGTYITTAVVDVKKGPGPNYETIRTLPKGKAFEIIGREGRWLKVRLSEHEPAPGYLDASYAVVWKASDSPRKLPIPGTYSTTTAIEARSGPGTHHPVVATIPKGSRITVVGVESNWLRITSKHGDPPRYLARDRARLQPAE